MSSRSRRITKNRDIAVNWESSVSGEIFTPDHYTTTLVTRSFAKRACMATRSAPRGTSAWRDKPGARPQGAGDAGDAQRAVGVSRDGAVLDLIVGQGLAVLSGFGVAGVPFQ
jgi:hypothetical protein